MAEHYLALRRINHGSKQRRDYRMTDLSRPFHAIDWTFGVMDSESFFSRNLKESTLASYPPPAAPAMGKIAAFIAGALLALN